MTVVSLLSSSPPRAFARSPTSALSSSPGFESPAASFKLVDRGQKRFKTVAIERDGFNTRPGRSRTVLGPKAGSQNVQLPQKAAVPDNSFQSPSPPPTTGERHDQARFAKELLRTYSYQGTTNQASVSSQRSNEGATVKKRCVDINEIVTSNSKSMAAPGIVPVRQPTAKRVLTKKKSPKKALTITGLATSHYFGEERRASESPMLQFLSTQAAKVTAEEEDELTPVTKRKRPPQRKSRAKKKVPKVILLSPESAMKKMDSQETVFGSFSQLARDEYPLLIRDTVEATKLSESFSVITPVPTQITVPSEPATISPRSRAHTGTARFAKSRNLWATAARDDENALLWQVDELDLFNTPAMREAFAGKDVLTGPGISRVTAQVSPEKATPSLRGGQLATPFPTLGNCIDIDDLATPKLTFGKVIKPHIQARALRTASTSPKGKIPEDPAESSVQAKEQPAGPAKPSYSGWTDAQLAKQIQQFGFKPIKQRQKMITMLDQCWEANHKPNAVNAQTITNVPKDEQEDIEERTHGDFLGKHYGVASRPKPKIPKPKRTKKDPVEKVAKTPKVKKVKSPKPKATPKLRKRVAAKPLDSENPTVEKPARKRKAKDPNAVSAPLKRKSTAKAKASALSEEYILNSSDAVESVTAEDLVVDEVEASTVPSKTPATPSPTASAEFVDSATPRAAQLASPELPDINKQITAAITTYKASPDRDHQRNPTWHEKILMYDPICLEELAGWLNTEGFQRIGEDREVSALEVRSYCEMKGLCCLGLGGGWRGVNGRGRGKGKANGGEVED